MIVTLDEMKNYLRVDSAEDDGLIKGLLSSAESLCSDILRAKKETLTGDANGKAAVMYACAYLYEHREEADHHELTLTLRSLLFGSREVSF